MNCNESKKNHKLEYIFILIKTNANLKIPGHNGIHGFWIKRFKSILNILIQGLIPTRGKSQFMDEEKKNYPGTPPQGNISNNHRLITCLRKIPTAQIRKKQLAWKTKLFPKEQKRCRREFESRTIYCTYIKTF